MERGEDYSYGNLENFSLIQAFGVGNLTLGSLNSSTGWLDVRWLYKEDFVKQLPLEKQEALALDPWNPIKEAYRYDVTEVLDMPKVRIDGNVNIGALSIITPSIINGNITTNGTITREQYYAGQYTYGTPGYAFFGGSYDLGGNVVNGDINVSLLSVGSHQPHNVNLEVFKEKPVGALIVNGDVTTDWLVVDTCFPNNPDSEYDNFGEYIQVTGTAHVKEDVLVGGSMDINKLIVDGTFYNAFGKYYEYPSLPAMVEDRIEGLNPPDYIASRINELDAKNIQNASNLFVGTLTNDREQVYTQTYGTIRVTDNWFRARRTHGIFCRPLSQN